MSYLFGMYLPFGHEFLCTPTLVDIRLEIYYICQPAKQVQKYANYLA